MDQKKIGRFISELRKEQSITQLELANRLGVTDRAISKWENGRGLPDVSLFQPLCKELHVSVNELLQGERNEIKDTETLSAETILEYSRYLKQKEKCKTMGSVILMLAILLLSVITVLLISNKTFFGTMYHSDFADGVSIPIPRFSYYRRTGGLDEYTTTLKTLKDPDEISVFIDNYLRTLESVEYQNKTYYYDGENDFTILQYRINNDGVGQINTIYITYCKGRIWK